MTQETKPSAGKPWPVIIMLGMLALVIGLGFILSPKSEDGKLWWVEFLGTTNNGILVNPPVELSSHDILIEQGADWPALNQPTFKLLVLNEGDCAEACQDMLYDARQLHVRLNRDYEDVERGFLPLNLGAKEASALVAELPDYAVLKLGTLKLLDRLAGTNIPAIEEGPLLVLIDPLNVIMMAYTGEHSGSEVLEDLEHLLELAR